jgi:predicted permease
MSDLRLALRILARNPGSTALIVGLLALGIGASTVIFSLFDAVLLRQLPVSHPEELVRMVQHLPKFPAPRSSFAYPYYEALRDHATTLAAFAETDEYQRFGMTSPEPAEQITVRGVSPEFFDALGARPLYGRMLKADDAERNSDTPPAVLSYGFWRRRFHGDPSVVEGQTILVNKQRFSIVGVMPRDFNGTSMDTAPEMRIPLRAYRVLTNTPVEQLYLELAGRLKPGITLARAEAESFSIWRQTMKDYYQNVDKMPPKAIATMLRRGMNLDSLKQGTSILREHFGDVFKLLMACVGLLVLIVCTNVAGLLLARAAGRQQEMAVRLAVGATRLRLVRQTGVESSLLAGLGILGGLAIAMGAIPVAVRLLPPLRDLSGSLVPLAIDPAGSPRIFWFALGVSALTMLLFSVSPAITAARSSLDGTLRAVRASSGMRGRQFLIALQIAVCTFLLVAASLFVRTLLRLEATDPGFARDRVATFTCDLNRPGGTEALVKDIIARVSEIPGVVSVAASNTGVMRGHGVSASVAPAGERIAQADAMGTNVNLVSLHYFDTMGMRLLEGRDFITADAAGPKPANAAEAAVSQRKAIVSEKFVQHFFPHSDPIGKRFGNGVEGAIAKGAFEIVGVVSDAKYRSLREPITPMYYTFETNFSSFVLNVRTRMQPGAIVEPVRRATARITPDLPFVEAHTLAEEVGESTAPERIAAIVASLFGAIAALLVGAGTYGLLAYTVTQRRREIGIRMALGAQPRHVATLIGKQTAVMTASGVFVGVGAALLAGRGVRTLLYGISPQDPQSLLAAVAFVVLTAALATILPVLDATETEPAETLRAEN